MLSLKHHFQVRGCRLQFELQVRHPGSKKVKRNQRENGNTQTAGRGNERFGDAPSDGLHSQLFVPQKTERPNKTGNGAQQTEQGAKVTRVSMTTRNRTARLDSMPAATLNGAWNEAGW